jgi:DNA-directed RNA polymerase specialized sigma24 family protein
VVVPWTEERCYLALLRYARYLMRWVSDCAVQPEDLVQEAWLTCNRRTGRTDLNFWELKGHVHWTYLTWLRKRRPMVSLDTVTTGGVEDQALASAELAGVLALAAGDIGVTALVLQGMGVSQAELATFTGGSEGAYKTMTWYARRYLRGQAPERRWHAQVQLMSIWT